MFSAILLTLYIIIIIFLTSDENNCALAIKFAITINIYYLRYWKSGSPRASLSRARGLRVRYYNGHTLYI